MYSLLNADQRSILIAFLEFVFECPDLVETWVESPTTQQVYVWRDSRGGFYWTEGSEPENPTDRVFCSVPCLGLVDPDLDQDWSDRLHQAFVSLLLSY